MTDPIQLLRSYSPPVQAPSLGPSNVSYVVEDTVIGRMLLARNESGALIASSFVPDENAEERVLLRISAQVSPRVLRRPADLDAARAELESFLAGRSRAFSVPVDLALASPFQRTVLGRLPSTVGYGQRASYAAVAAAIERPTAARAVGTALGANPLCVVLPCHRVVASNGALTGYAGGLEAKAFLLELESRA